MRRHGPFIQNPTLFSCTTVTFLIMIYADIQLLLLTVRLEICRQLWSPPLCCMPYCLFCVFRVSFCVFRVSSLNTVTFPGERVCERSSDCSHYCHDAPMGSVCYCPSHLHLQPDKMTCLTSHPCEAWGVCSQLCQPSKFGHKCLCEEGYKLQHDGFTCKSTGNFPLTDSSYL